MSIIREVRSKESHGLWCNASPTIPPPPSLLAEDFVVGVLRGLGDGKEEASSCHDFLTLGDRLLKNRPVLALRILRASGRRFPGFLADQHRVPGQVPVGNTLGRADGGGDVFQSGGVLDVVREAGP